MASCPKCKRRYAETQTTCDDDGEVLLPEAFLSSSTDRELRRGDTVGEYVVEAKIGSGTFGDVYRAVQPLIGKQVAIKVLSRKYSADPHIVSRFIAEARAVNQIRHKHIIDIFSFGQLSDGRHYHIMELLLGTTLERYLKDRGRLSIVEAIPILRALGRALDAAHAAGIAHRDLKPANVFLASDDEGRPFPKLLDFGIAKLLSDDVPRQHQTATGAAVGTPDYMSPEQCQGPNVDHRTDVYSFGVMTYQLLTGQLPFSGQNVVEVLVKQMTASPEAPSAVCPDLPASLDEPILRMLEKDKAKRPESLARASRELEEAAIKAGVEVPQTGSTGDPSARGPLPPPPVARPRGPGGTVSDRPVEAARRRTSSQGEGGLPASGDRPAPLGESLLADTLPSGGRLASEPAAPTVRVEAGGSRVKVAVAALAVLAAIPAFVMFTKFRAAPSSPPALASPPSGEESELETPQPDRVPRAKPEAHRPAATASTATASARVEVEPAGEDRTISLRVETDPKGVEIFAPGGVLLGRAPCAVHLLRGPAPIKLEFRAPGYLPATKEVSPLADGAIEVTLKKKVSPHPIKKKPDRDDIEDAFE